MPELMDKGRFRGNIVDYSLFESSNSESQSVGVKIVVSLKDIWQDGEWQDISDHNFTTSGLINVVKRDGKINQRQVECLIEYAGWSGRFSHIVEREWHPNPIGVTVEENHWDGKVEYRINWINAFDDAGESGGGATVDVANGLDTRFGSIMRGMASNAQRNSAKPTGKPTKFVQSDDNDVPF